jgi:hypothetical protein
MKNIVILIFILSGFFNQSYGQSSYRIKPFADKGNFIYPPHSKLKHGCNDSIVKKSCRYQYIFIDSLSMTNGNYYSVLNLLNEAEYFSSKDSIDKYSIDKICFDTECDGCDDKTKARKKLSLKQKKRKQKSKGLNKLEVELAAKVKANTAPSDSEICEITEEDEVGGFYKIKYSRDRKAFLLQIDYSRIIDGKTEHEIRKSFFELAKRLLIEFQKREGNGSIEKFGWPTSISQDVVEKIFELIPIPQEASLARYALDVNKEFSFVLLNPKIWIMVDHTERSMARFPESRIDSRNWQMNYYGQSVIRFYRNNKGNIRQTPFIETNNLQPLNKPLGNIKNSVLFSSSIDMQVTSGTNGKEKRFIGIHQYSKVRGNNSVSVDEDDHQFDNVNRNTQLLFMDNLDYNFFDRLLSKENPAEQANNGIIAATYGMRNILTPVIQIYVNGQSLTVPLNSSYGTLVQMGIIPSIDGIKLYRQGYRGYKRVKGPLTELKLLPNDKITF